MSLRSTAPVPRRGPGSSRRQNWRHVRGSSPHRWRHPRRPIENTGAHRLETPRTENRPWGFMIRMDVTPDVIFPGQRARPTNRARVGDHLRRSKAMSPFLVSDAFGRQARPTSPSDDADSGDQPTDRDAGRNRPKGGALHNAGV